MSKKNKRSLESHLENLLAHILKWKNQAQKRSKSWENTIKESRRAIQEVKKEQPSLNDKYIESIFDKTLKNAKKAAEEEMKENVKNDSLTWDEVFKMPYLLAIIFIIFLITIFLV